MSCSVGRLTSTSGSGTSERANHSRSSRVTPGELRTSRFTKTTYTARHRIQPSRNGGRVSLSFLRLSPIQHFHPLVIQRAAWKLGSCWRRTLTTAHPSTLWKFTRIRYFQVLPTIRSRSGTLRLAPLFANQFYAGCDLTSCVLQTGNVDSTFEHPEWVKRTLVQFPYLIVGGKQEDISVWDLSTEKLKLVIRGHYDEVSSLGRLAGSKFISAGLDETLRIWDLKG